MSTATLIKDARKESFTGALHSEWVKFRGLTSNLVLVFLTFGLIVANAVLMPWAYVLRDRGSVLADYDAYPEMVIDKTAYFGLILAVVAALMITGEYRSGQITSSLLALPKRTPLLLAKASLISLIAFLIGVASTGIGFLLAPPILATGGYSYVLGPGECARLVFGSGLYLALLSLLGLAIGVLVRNVVASVLLVLALALAIPYIPQVFSSFGAQITAYFPVQAGARMLSVPETGQLGPWVGIAVMTIWTTATMIGAAIFLRNRDA